MKSFFAMAALVMATGGCRILVELVESDDNGASVADASMAEVDADTVCDNWMPNVVGIDPCDAPRPAGALTLTPGIWSFDTNSGVLTNPAFESSFPPSALVAQSGGPEVRVLSVDSFGVQVGAELRVTGARPLIVLSWSNTIVEGTIEASSSAAGAGAGANPPVCAVTAPGFGDGNADKGAGGGGGGGFAGEGGDGGDGDDGNANGGAGGLVAAASSALRGGCAGAAGGNASAGSGGDGGGAFELLARELIVVSGTLATGGSGGGASRGARSGGGGGGSGGMLIVQAPSVVVARTAVIVANGGGGGGGSDNDPASPGEDALRSTMSAQGGDKQGAGGDGGDGGSLESSAKNGKDSKRGSGGGGGAVGRISAYTDGLQLDPAAAISPALIPLTASAQ